MLFEILGRRIRRGAIPLRHRSRLIRSHSVRPFGALLEPLMNGYRDRRLLNDLRRRPNAAMAIVAIGEFGRRWWWSCDGIRSSECCFGTRRRRRALPRENSRWLGF